MKRRIAVFGFVLGMLVFVRAAVSATTQQSYTGSCPSGSVSANWTTVVVYGDNGRPIYRAGIACNGLSWTDECPQRILQCDPGVPSTTIINLANQGYIKFNMNAEGIIHEMWGRDINGIYWTVDIDNDDTNLY